MSQKIHFRNASLKEDTLQKCLHQGGVSARQCPSEPLSALALLLLSLSSLFADREDSIQRKPFGRQQSLSWPLGFSFSAGWTLIKSLSAASLQSQQDGLGRCSRHWHPVTDTDRRLGVQPRPGRLPLCESIRVATASAPRGHGRHDPIPAVCAGSPLHSRSNDLSESIRTASAPRGRRGVTGPDETLDSAALAARARVSQPRPR